MPNCCGGASCSCVIQGGSGITVTGAGTTASPFILDAHQVFNAVDNKTFDLSITGSGTTIDPWTVQVTWAATAQLDDFPDVQAPTPTNGQVLGWDNTLQKWTPRAPTTAAAGAVLHDTSLTGDGSSGAPLAVQTESGRRVQSAAAGIGLNDLGMRELVRHFTDPLDLANYTGPTPIVNSLAVLDSAPGLVWFWDGSGWDMILGSVDRVVTGPALLEMSGPYTDTRMTQILKRIETVTTDADGLFPILTSDDLAGRGGVISVVFQPTSDTRFAVQVLPSVDHIDGVAWVGGTTDGTPGTTPLALTDVEGTIEAWVY